MDNLRQKKQKLYEYLKKLGGAAVAFSSGADSTYLLKAAHDVLGDRAIAVTACSDFFTQREKEEAIRFCTDNGINQILFDFDQMAIGDFAQNPKNRCYICKRELFRKIIGISKTEELCRAGVSCVIEGSNADDIDDYRPGMQALKELGIKSPLLEAGLTKTEIRELSKREGLSTWDKPSFACLASRFAYGEIITPQRLNMVSAAEQKLRDLGFGQLRVRMHGSMARIEIMPDEFEKLLQGDTASRIDDYFHSLGFKFAALDLGGYSTGSMNRETK
ncbi:MAG: ATP-dependent sacrificial sulfur transferase LarE [Clostridia bacterium]|nr:ATP-dependent sacrificial sulfur transferase LarE [Clostridia bacterium]